MRLFSDKGWDRAGGGTRGYPGLGLNYRASELVAAVALPQLSSLDDALARRRHSATLLDAAVDKAPGMTRWQPLSGCDTSYWCYPFSAPAGETAPWAEALAAEGVPTTPGYIGEPIYTCMAALRDDQYPPDLSPRGTDPADDLLAARGPHHRRDLRRRRRHHQGRGRIRTLTVAEAPNLTSCPRCVFVFLRTNPLRSRALISDINIMSS